MKQLAVENRWKCGGNARFFIDFRALFYIKKNTELIVGNVGLKV